jgi:hypothetical protein
MFDHLGTFHALKRSVDGAVLCVRVPQNHLMLS